MKTVALSSAVMLGALTSAAMAEPAATTSAESLVELLDEQLDEVTGGSATVVGTRGDNQSYRSGDHGRHKLIVHRDIVT